MQEPKPYFFPTLNSKKDSLNTQIRTFFHKKDRNICVYKKFVVILHAFFGEGAIV